ncbi:hypothetical protein TPR58_17500 [Sphingomonas sp. HF-S3]|jgi:hypothetical protein|uniref:Uncharacterized protein n=1 Tax=Sphingomonas rustica TaxID=3103142 RepID=A0ABV0BFW7_9SPHN
MAVGALPVRAGGRHAEPVRYYAVGARAEGAIAFDMESLSEEGGIRSIRVWEFNPTPELTETGFKLGRVQRIALDCAGERLRLYEHGVFAAIDRVELQPELAPYWLDYRPPTGAPDASLATTAWQLLCRGQVPASWVAYDALDLIAKDYWSFLQPVPDPGQDPHAVQPPSWAGPNATEPTGPPLPEQAIPW